MSTRFKLLDLIFAAGVVALLVGILLVAFPTHKGKDRRAQCANNLKNVVLGFLQYESAFGHSRPA